MFGAERDTDLFKTHPVESEPMIQFKKLFLQAERASNNSWAHNFSLCTVDPDGQPTSRVVSLHSFDERGFFFCTNIGSPKAKDLELNPKAAMVFQWEPIRAQVRITGEVEMQDAETTMVLFNRCSKSEKLYYISCSQGPDHPWAQGTPIPKDANWEEWKSEVLRNYSAVDEADILLPPNWRAYLFKPKTLEILNLMIFTDARVKWTRGDDGEWRKDLLAL